MNSSLNGAKKSKTPQEREEAWKRVRDRRSIEINSTKGMREAALMNASKPGLPRLEPRVPARRRLAQAYGAVIEQIRAQA